MKVSYYNVMFPYDDSYILFNTLRGAVFVVDSETREVLMEGKLSALGEELTDLFTTHGIIVKNGVNECDEYRLMYEKSKYATNSTTLHIITTYSCNLACTYCYEGKGEIEQKSMDTKEAERAIHFVENLTESNNSSSLGIELFGGEPFLNMPINTMVARELEKWCEETSRNFSINAVTNGTLSTQETVEELAQYKCSFLVTVDGTKEIHDQRRRYKDGRGTFDDIMDGLWRVRDSGLHIMVRINVDEYNKEYIVPLFDFLKEGGLEDTLISIKPVFNSSPACLSYGYCLPDTEELRTINDLCHCARERAFKTEEPEKVLPQGPCSAQRSSYFTIDPYLRLFKCAILPPYEENSAGLVDLESSRPLLNSVHTDFMLRNPMEIEPCKTCEYVPICRGGCPVEIYQTQGTARGYICRKPEFQEVIQQKLLNIVKKHSSCDHALANGERR
ncbi:MAG: radical SAM protein [Theionarchaea archaeon]|nr:radical SAM protein [Theionarchaea archaeon]